MVRERLGSRLGFILLSAGCAIGCGNVWKFPWLTGQYGGGAFVLVYILFLILIGLPVMTMEFSLGRASQKSPVRLYQALEPEGTKWHIHGYGSFVANVVLMMFYTVVTAWMFYYFVEMACGSFDGKSPKEVGDAFGALLSDPETMIGYMLLVVVMGFFVLSFSLKGGLERINKYMMILLLGIMILLVGNSLTLEGVSQGLSFYLVPDFSKITPNVVVNAMNQAFFTLSLGIGSLAIFGSYLGRERTLMGESLHVIYLDTFVAICAGFIIFPACFTYGVEPGAGPGLIFVTLPNIFIHMPMGRVWGSLFFLFMSFAAFSTILAVFENISSCVRDMTGWDRPKTSLICCVSLAVLSVPCVLGFNIWSDFQPLGAGTGVLDLEDFLVSYIALPLGSLTFVLFCTNKMGFTWEKFVKEANMGKGLKVGNWARFYCTYVLPLIILVIFLIGIFSFFK